ncbi:MAG: sulfatase [Planctomycetota bacterium]
MRILYLDLDALNPTHLSCYGYPRHTSPNIDRLASSGVRCTSVYASDAPCLPSRTAFYSGRLGIQTGVVGHGQTAADPKVQGPSRDFMDHYTLQGLAGQLVRRGYHTAMISPFGDRHSAHHFYAGFREIHNTGKNGHEIVDEVEPTLNRWLDHHATEDHWYLHVNFWDIHTPYRTPPGFGDPFANDALPDWYTPELIAGLQSRGGPHSAQDLGMYVGAAGEDFRDGGPDAPRFPDQIDTMDNLRQWINGYDAAIKYVDQAVGRLLAKLEDAGVMDDTLVIVAADHGENQGDLGLFGEHGTADHATCHIPFIVRGPGVVAGHVDDALHYHLDFAPTLLDLIDGDDRRCPEIWDGRSWAATLREGEPAGRDDVVISQCCHVAQRSVRFDEGDRRWLYMRTYHDGFHNFPQEMLFDLAIDPHELNNVAIDQPELCAQGAWRLARWHDANMQKMVRFCSDAVDPLWTVIREGGPHHANLIEGRGQPQARFGGLPGYLDRLRQTGRAAHAQGIIDRHAARYADHNPTKPTLE